MTTWNEVSARLGRNDLPRALAYAVYEGRLTDPEEVGLGVEDAWTMAEWPSQAMTEDLWVDLFETATGGSGYLLDGVAHPADELPATTTLYRGAAKGHEAGMAWTDDRKQAEWFATRFGGHIGGDHVLLTVEAPRDAVLARFNRRRNENEWVLHPEYVAELLDASLVSSEQGGG